MVVLQNKNIISKVGRINKRIFYQGLPPKIELKVSDEQPSIADDNRIRSAFYDAPTLITVLHLKHTHMGLQMVV
jgi:hypothetical protein